MRDQIADTADLRQGVSQQPVLDLASGPAFAGEGEDTVGNVVEVGMDVLHRVGLTVDDRRQNVDENMGSAFVGLAASREPRRELIENHTDRETDGNEPFRRQDEAGRNHARAVRHADQRHAEIQHAIAQDEAAGGFDLADFGLRWHTEPGRARDKSGLFGGRIP